MLKILIGGSRKSGKTTFLKTLLGYEPVKVEREETLIIETGFLALKNLPCITFVALSDSKRFKEFWQVCSKGAKGFIFIFDAQNKEGWELVREEVKTLVDEDKHKVVYVLNKFDPEDEETLVDFEEFVQSLGISGKILVADVRKREEAMKILKELMGELGYVYEDCSGRAHRSG